MDSASELGWHCGDAYASGRASGEKLLAAANFFKERVKKAGPFTISELYVPPSKAFPQRERHAICAFFMEPIGLAQVDRAEANPYVEEAVLLRTCQSEFRGKKANFGFGTGTLVLTQHLLERVYERTNAHHDEFMALINSELQDFLHGVALTVGAGLWIGGQDEHGKFRLGAVPYSEGLVTLEARVIVAEADRSELGFRLQLPSCETHMPFVNPTSVVEGPICDSASLKAIEVTFGVTYLRSAQLRPEQRRYLDSYHALKTAIGAEILGQLAEFYCAPRFPHQMPTPIQAPESATVILEHVRGMLPQQGLHPSRSCGVCLLTASRYATSA